MRRVGKTLICLLGTTALVAGVRAAVNDSSSDNPYNAIVQRNIFDLKAAPNISEVSSPPPAPPLNVKLTGLTTIMGYPQALFMVTEPPSPGKPPAKEESFIMIEGERQGALELVKIDLKAGKAQIKNDGIASTIALEVPKAIAPGSMGQGMPGGPGGMRPGFAPPPGAIPGGFNPSPVNGAVNSFPTRTQRTAYDGSQGYGQPQTPLGAFSGGQPAAQPSAPQQPAISPAEQIMRTEQQKLQLLNEGNPMAGLLPSLPGSPSEQQSGAGASTPTAPAASAPPPLGTTATGTLINKYNIPR